MVDIDLQPYQSFTASCPKCSDSRHKQGTRSLSVYRDEDGYIRFKCHHPGCEYNSWQKVVDPEPAKVVVSESPTVLIPIPDDVTIPDDYANCKLYWYRDQSGKPLFASRRIDLPTGKVYTPFVYNGQGGFSSGKGTKWPAGFKGLYGAQTIPGKTKAIVVEGEKAADAAAIRFPNHAVVSWHGGANKNVAEVDWSPLNDMSAVLLWPDNDAPGKEVMHKISNHIRAGKVLVADVSHLPAKFDLADPVTDEDVKIAIERATEIKNKTPGVFSMDDLKNQLQSIGAARKTGYPVFDGHTALPSSGLLVVEGRTKHGKSALAVALTSNMLRHDLVKKVLFYSFEMQAVKVFARYLGSVDPNTSLDNFEERGSPIIDLIDRGKLQIVDQSSQPGLAQIVLSVASPEMRGGIVVIDYLQIIPLKGGQASRQLLIKEVLDEIRVEAHKNNVLVLVLSQLTPDYNNPSNDAPREARDIHYSADQVLRVWNKSVGDNHPKYEKLKGKYVIHVFLNRDGESNIVFDSTLEKGMYLNILNRAKEV